MMSRRVFFVKSPLVEAAVDGQPFYGRGWLPAPFLASLTLSGVDGQCGCRCTHTCQGWEGL